MPFIFFGITWLVKCSQTPLLTAAIRLGDFSIIASLPARLDNAAFSSSSRLFSVASCSNSSFYSITIHSEFSQPRFELHRVSRAIPDRLLVAIAAHIATRIFFGTEQLECITSQCQKSEYQSGHRSGHWAAPSAFSRLTHLPGYGELRQPTQ